VRRARAYVAAGADGVFVPGVADADTIRRLAAAVGAPLNVIGGPGVAERARAARAGRGARERRAGARARGDGARPAAATEVLGPGTYEALREQIPSPEANALFAARPAAT
jgi:hypothetical protein